MWGGGFIAQADAMRGLGPLWFTTLRYALAVVALAPVAWSEARAGGTSVVRGDVGLLIALGLAFSAGSLLQQYAITRTSVTHVGFLTGLYVLFVPLFGAAALRQRPHPTVLVAAVAALAGTWLIGGGLDGLTGGDLLAIGCAMAFAVQILLIDRIVHRTGRPATAVLIQSLFCAGFTLPVAMALESFDAGTLPSVLPALLYAGIASGGIAFLLQAMGQRAVAPAVAAVLLMSESLFAALFAVLLLHEHLTWEGWAGCALLFASLLLAQMAPSREAAAP